MNCALISTSSKTKGRGGGLGGNKTPIFENAKKEPQLLFF